MTSSPSELSIGRTINSNTAIETFRDNSASILLPFSPLPRFHRRVPWLWFLFFVIISQPRKRPPSPVTSSSNPQEGHSSNSRSSVKMSSALASCLTFSRCRNALTMRLIQTSFMVLSRLKFRYCAQHEFVEKGDSKGHVAMDRAVNHPLFAAYPITRNFAAF